VIKSTFERVDSLYHHLRTYCSEECAEVWEKGAEENAKICAVLDAKYKKLEEERMAAFERLLAERKEAN
jgi:hypothetical protein